MSHLQIRNLNKIFKGRKNGGSAIAVKDFSLDVSEGELITLLGPSGCGKTTVLRIIAGLEHPTSGTISLGDKDITFLPPDKRDTAMVFQHYALFPHMDVFHNVEFGLKFKRKFTKEKRKERVKQFLDMVELSDFSRRMPSQLSGGQQQRVALARALVIEPKVLLCDEPLSNLDTEMRLQMRKEIKRLHDKTEATTIYVTHDHEEAEFLADRIVTMKDGKIETGKN